MITIKSIRQLHDDDGLTLIRGQPVKYKTGWQVCTEGVIVETPEEALKAVVHYNGNCGIWFYEGKYYIDKCIRVSTKHEALKLAAAHHQIAIFNWSKMKSEVV